MSWTRLTISNIYIMKDSTHSANACHFSEARENTALVPGLKTASSQKEANDHEHLLPRRDLSFYTCFYGLL